MGLLKGFLIAAAACTAHAFTAGPHSLGTPEIAATAISRRGGGLLLGRQSFHLNRARVRVHSPLVMSPSIHQHGEGSKASFSFLHAASLRDVLVYWPKLDARGVVFLALTEDFRLH